MGSQARGLVLWRVRATVSTVFWKRMRIHILIGVVLLRLGSSRCRWLLKGSLWSWLFWIAVKWILIAGFGRNLSIFALRSCWFCWRARMCRWSLLCRPRLAIRLVSRFGWRLFTVLRFGRGLLPLASRLAAHGRLTVKCRLALVYLTRQALPSVSPKHSASLLGTWKVDLLDCCTRPTLNVA